MSKKTLTLSKREASWLADAARYMSVNDVEDDQPRPLREAEVQALCERIDDLLR